MAGHGGIISFLFALDASHRFTPDVPIAPNTLGWAKGVRELAYYLGFQSHSSISGRMARIVRVDQQERFAKLYGFHGDAACMQAFQSEDEDLFRAAFMRLRNLMLKDSLDTAVDADRAAPPAYEIEVVLTINRSFDSFTEADIAKFLGDIDAMLNSGRKIELKRKEPGSVKLTVMLTPDEFRRLGELLEEGQLDALQVVQVASGGTSYRKKGVEPEADTTSPGNERKVPAQPPTDPRSPNGSDRDQPSEEPDGARRRPGGTRSPVEFPNVRGTGFLYIEKDRLVARFPRVHPHAETELMFQRTMRVPDDGKVYPLPAGLGHFALRHLDDFAEHLPPGWGDRGGVLMPMRRGDAMWIAFDSRYPCAIKIGAGKVNILSGRRWTERLQAGGNDYLVAPPQAALDGFRTRERDVARQFVVVPLGRGYSVEEQISGVGKHGGIQIVVYPMKAARYELLRAQHAAAGGGAGDSGGPEWAVSHMMPEEITPLSLAAGGRMQERVVADPYGIEAWDQAARVRCFITLVDGEELWRLTGIPVSLPPTFTAADYRRESLPWFQYDNDGLEPLGGADAIPEIKGIVDINASRGLPALEFNDPIAPREVRQLRLVRPPRRTRHQSRIVRAYWTVRNAFLNR